MNLESFVASLFGSRYGFHFAGLHLWARFHRDELICAPKAVRNAYELRMAHFEQVGF